MADPSGPSGAEEPDAPEGGLVNHQAPSPPAEAPPAVPSVTPAPAPETDRHPIPPAAEVADEPDAREGDRPTTEHQKPEANPEQVEVRPVAAAPVPVTEGSGAGVVDDERAPSDLDAGADDDDLDDEDGEEDEGDEPGRPKGGLLTRQIQITPLTVLVIALVLALFAGAYVLGRRQASDSAATGTSTVTTTPNPPGDLVPFEDKETGIKLSIPRDWPQRSTKNLGPATRMFLEVPNSQDTVVLRVNSYSKEVTAGNLGDQKAVIDGLFSEAKITILGVEAGDLQGMPVLVYIYTFVDPTSGVTGIHAHYFVFQGRKAVQMVFQALPQDHYTTGGLGLVWSRISKSLQVAPGDPPAFLQDLVGGAATTAPGATTVPTAATVPPVTTSTP